MDETRVSIHVCISEALQIVQHTRKMTILLPDSKLLSNPEYIYEFKHLLKH